MRVEPVGPAVTATEMPRILYGTAWKEERTTQLVREALAAGFRGIDTANQRKHYHEAGVGEALRAARVPRDELFLQTKFTHLRGQDARLPYDAAAPVGEQVRQSFARSLEHLGVERLDSLLLHGPSVTHGLAPADVEAWRAMEALLRDGRVGMIGASNVSHEQLVALWELADVKPRAVQDRTLVAGPRCDEATRAFCRERGIRYQGFSLLTAAPALLSHAVVRDAAARTGLAPGAVVLRFWMDQGVTPLTGTTDAKHMRDDLAALDAPLTREESGAIAQLLGLS